VTEEEFKGGLRRYRRAIYPRVFAVIGFAAFALWGFVYPMEVLPLPVWLGAYVVLFLLGFVYVKHLDVICRPFEIRCPHCGVVLSGLNSDFVLESGFCPKCSAQLFDT